MDGSLPAKRAYQKRIAELDGESPRVLIDVSSIFITPTDLALWLEAQEPQDQLDALCMALGDHADPKRPFWSATCELLRGLHTAPLAQARTAVAMATALLGPLQTYIGPKIFADVVERRRDMDRFENGAWDARGERRQAVRS